MAAREQSAACKRTRPTCNRTRPACNPLHYQELRYLTLPVLLLRLHAPPLLGPGRWLPPLLGFAAINAAAVALFLGRPYTWGDGTTARLMW